MRIISEDILNTIGAGAILAACIVGESLKAAAVCLTVAAGCLVINWILNGRGNN